GVDFSPSGDRIYVGGGTNNSIMIFSLASDGSFVADGSISIPSSAPSGLKVNKDGSRLYVALNTSHELAIIDTFTEIVGLLVFTSAVGAVLESSSYFVVRRRVAGVQLTPFHPVLPAVFILANLALAVWVAVNDPIHTLYGIAVLALACAAYGALRLVQ